MEHSNIVNPKEMSEYLLKYLLIEARRKREGEKWQDGVIDEEEIQNMW